MTWPDAGETRDLLDKVERGEDGAADRLWDRLRDPLRRMIGLRLDHAVGRRVDASDVVQDVMIKATLRLREYLRSPVIPFQVWLRRIALDQVIDQHRRHRVAGRRSLDRERPIGQAFADESAVDLAALVRDPNLTPAAAAIRAELDRRFRDTLETLDHDDREVLLLRHSDGLSNSETARVLGLSDPAAGMRYLRALRRLRAALGETPSRVENGVSRP